eukprot:4138311-Amphidinium_carterae.1
MPWKCACRITQPCDFSPEGVGFKYSLMVYELRFARSPLPYCEHTSSRYQNDLALVSEAGTTPRRPRQL